MVIDNKYGTPAAQTINQGRSIQQNINEENKTQLLQSEISNYEQQKLSDGYKRQGDKLIKEVNGTTTTISIDRMTGEVNIDEVTRTGGTTTRTATGEYQQIEKKIKATERALKNSSPQSYSYINSYLQELYNQRDRLANSGSAYNIVVTPVTETKQETKETLLDRNYLSYDYAKDTPQESKATLPFEVGFSNIPAQQPQRSTVLDRGIITNKLPPAKIETVITARQPKDFIRPTDDNNKVLGIDTVAAIDTAQQKAIIEGGVKNYVAAGIVSYGFGFLKGGSNFLEGSKNTIVETGKIGTSIYAGDFKSAGGSALKVGEAFNPLNIGKAALEVVETGTAFVSSPNIISFSNAAATTGKVAGEVAPAIIITRGIGKASRMIFDRQKQLIGDFDTVKQASSSTTKSTTVSRDVSSKYLKVIQDSGDTFSVSGKAYTKKLAVAETVPTKQYIKLNIVDKATGRSGQRIIAQDLKTGETSIVEYIKNPRAIAKSERSLVREITQVNKDTANIKVFNADVYARGGKAIVNKDFKVTPSRNLGTTTTKQMNTERSATGKKTPLDKEFKIKYSSEDLTVSRLENTKGNKPRLQSQSVSNTATEKTQYSLSGDYLQKTTETTNIRQQAQLSKNRIVIETKTPQGTIVTTRKAVPKISNKEKFTPDTVNIEKNTQGDVIRITSTKEPAKITGVIKTTNVETTLQKLTPIQAEKFRQTLTKIETKKEFIKRAESQYDKVTATDLNRQSLLDNKRGSISISLDKARQVITPKTELAPKVINIQKDTTPATSVLSNTRINQINPQANTGTIIVPLIRTDNNNKIENKPAFKLENNNIIATKINNKLDNEIRVDNDLKQSFEEKNINTPTIIQEVRIKQQQQQEQVQIQQTRQLNKLTPVGEKVFDNPNTFINTPIRPVKTTPPPTILGGNDKTLQRSSFFTKVKEKGKFRVLGEFKTMGEAFNRGKQYVENTAAATFKIESNVGGSIRPSGILPRGFGLSKSSPGAIIQQRGYRIKSQGEKRAISSKGRAVQQIRRTMKKRRGIF